METATVAQTRAANRETAGKLATFVWLGSGLYLFATYPEASFLSWQAAVFFLGGMFAAAIILGAASYLLREALTLIAMRMPRSPITAASLGLLGILLFVGDFVVGFLAARWVFKWLVG